ncbi:MAG: ATP12 family protein [Roseovarius sp.]
MSGWKAKRFWKAAEVVPLEGGYTVELDGRPMKTPAKAALHLPTRAMAEAVAAEWQAQEGEVKPNTMPVTRAANSAIDNVSRQHAEVAGFVAAYGDSDLTCYRADGPAELVARQQEAWDPLLDWVEARYGVRLLPVAGVIHQPQPARAVEALSAEVHAAGPFELTALHDLVALSGSLVIGLAAFHDAREPEQLWHLSRIDETWQAEQWGADEEAQAVAALKQSDFLAAKRFLNLARASN